ncbi:ABC transporter permease [Anoxynatronum buryatiense]|uniref:ABC-2 type transport system permease protein n=1 Tax=Anoxynatronum buryatiense TaxID=489973 RepID=A0AA45WXD5_9CLOT|nr:ABC transporter permease [Anoxynatronum buryatiense]SMP63506.1 ABC-2 type transport system permease protein [Anoxynatronum buryatiense]
MSVVTIFWYTLKQNWRDRSTYLEMMLLPLALIFILGVSLAPAFHVTLLPTIETALFVEDQGPAGAGLKQFLLEREEEGLLKIQPVLTEQAGKERVKTGESHAFIHLPAGDTALQPASIQLLTDSQNSLRTSVLESLLNSFVIGLSSEIQPEQILPRPLAASEVLPGAMDYYAVTMMVMFIMYGAIYSVYGMKHCYLGPVGKRIASTPLLPGQHYWGLVLANLTTILMQSVIVVLFTRTVFGVNWGTNALLVGVIILLAGLVATGLGTALVMIVQDETLAGNIINVLVPAMTFLAGGFFRINFSDGSWISYLQYLSPNYLAQTALFTTIYGGDDLTIMVTLGVMGLFISVAFLAALLSERRARI